MELYSWVLRGLNHYIHGPSRTRVNNGTVIVIITRQIVNCFRSHLILFHILRSFHYFHYFCSVCNEPHVNTCIKCIFLYHVILKYVLQRALVMS